MPDQEIKPCPFCNMMLEQDVGSAVHPAAMCILSQYRVDDIDYLYWNYRLSDNYPDIQFNGGQMTDNHDGTFDIGAITPVHKLDDNEKIRQELFSASLNHDTGQSAQKAIDWAILSLQAFDKQFNTNQEGTVNE